MRPRIPLAVFTLVLLLGGIAFGRQASSNQSDAQPATRADIKIVQAWYGDADGDGKDVTAIVVTALARGDISITASNSVFTDTALGHRKLLWLKYTVRGVEETYSASENEVVFFSSLLPVPAKPSSLKVLSASYSGTDVTASVAAMVANGANSIPVNLTDFGIPDPAPGADKFLVINFQLADGSTRTLTGKEGNRIPLDTLVPLKLLPEVSNGSFDSTDSSMFASDQAYVAASPNALSKPGTFTISEGIMRPFQLQSSIRADFVQRTNHRGSMAMCVSPVPGRQPVLLWEEKVAVEPDSDYLFSCFVSDISDSNTLAATIALEAGEARSRPALVEDLYTWMPFTVKVHTGSEKQIFLKLYRDVLPYRADGPASLGIDDIRFAPVSR